MVKAKYNIKKLVRFGDSWAVTFNIKELKAKGFELGDIVGCEISKSEYLTQEELNDLLRLCEKGKIKTIVSTNGESEEEENGKSKS